MFSLAMGSIPRSWHRFGWAVAASVSEWMRIHSLTLAATSEMKNRWHLGLSEHDGSFLPTGFQPGHFCGFTRKVEERIALRFAFRQTGAAISAVEHPSRRDQCSRSNSRDDLFSRVDSNERSAA